MSEASSQLESEHADAEQGDLASGTSVAESASKGKLTTFTFALPVLGMLAFAGIVTTAALVFFFAPVEAQMGVAQKIFYFHVSSAYAMYLGFITCSIGGLLYLIKRAPKWDSLAVSGAEVGLVFCTMVLISGPLWGRKAWGVYWTWDPRLTTTLLAGLILAAFVGLRSFGEAGEAEKKFAALLGVVGIPNVVLIHYSVQRWRGQHPKVVSKGGGGLDPDMQKVFIVAMAAFTALAIYLIWLRFRAEEQAKATRELRYQFESAETS